METTVTFAETVWVPPLVKLPPFTVWVPSVYPVSAAKLIFSTSPSYTVPPVSFPAAAQGEDCRVTVMLDPVPAVMLSVRAVALATAAVVLSSG